MANWKLASLEEAQALAQAITQRFDGQINAKASFHVGTCEHESFGLVGIWADETHIVATVESMKQVDRLVSVARIMVAEDMFAADDERKAKT